MALDNSKIIAIDHLQQIVNVKWGGGPSIVWTISQTQGTTHDSENNTISFNPPLDLVITIENGEGDILVCDRSGDSGFNVFDDNLYIFRTAAVCVNLTQWSRDTVVKAEAVTTNGQLDGMVFSEQCDYSFLQWQKFLLDESQPGFPDDVVVVANFYNNDDDDGTTPLTKGYSISGFPFTPTILNAQPTLRASFNDATPLDDQQPAYAVWKPGTGGIDTGTGSPSQIAGAALGVPGFESFHGPIINVIGSILVNPVTGEKYNLSYVPAGIPELSLPAGYYYLTAPFAVVQADNIMEFLGISSYYSWALYSSELHPAIYALQVSESSDIHWEGHSGPPAPGGLTLQGVVASGPETFKVQYHPPDPGPIPFSDHVPTEHEKTGTGLWQVGDGHTGPVYYDTTPTALLANWQPYPDGNGGQLSVWPPPLPKPGNVPAWDSEQTLPDPVFLGIVYWDGSATSKQKGEFKFADFFDQTSNTKGAPDPVTGLPTAWTWQGPNTFVSVFDLPSGFGVWTPYLAGNFPPDNLNQGFTQRFWLSEEDDFPLNKGNDGST